MIQVTEKARETEEQLAEFRRKNDVRGNVLMIVAGVFWLMASIWGSIYFQGYENAFLWILGIVLGAILCIAAVMAPSLKRWRIARPNYVPPSPAGWGIVTLSIIAGILFILAGIPRIENFLKYGESDPSGFVEIITLLLVIILYLAGAFIYSVPQAIRSVHLYFAVPNDVNKRAIPMDCWRDEKFNQITMRLCKNRSFKRLLAKLQFTPNAPMKLLFHEKYLNPESTPTQEGVRSRSVMTVIIKDEESSLE